MTLLESIIATNRFMNLEGVRKLKANLLPDWGVVNGYIASAFHEG